jgi:hypothetical protein
MVQPHLDLYTNKIELKNQLCQYPATIQNSAILEDGGWKIID